MREIFYNDRHVHSVEYHEINKTISHCYIRASVIPSIPTQKENKFTDDITNTCSLNLADLLVGRKKPILHSFDSSTIFS